MASCVGYNQAVCHQQPFLEGAGAFMMAASPCQHSLACALQDMPEEARPKPVFTVPLDESQTECAISGERLEAVLDSNDVRNPCLLPMLVACCPGVHHACQTLLSADTCVLFSQSCLWMITHCWGVQHCFWHSDTAGSQSVQSVLLPAGLKPSAPSTKTCFKLLSPFADVGVQGCQASQP